jgi:hypothetical protein
MSASFELDAGERFADTLGCGCLAFVVAEPAIVGDRVTCERHGPTFVAQVQGGIRVVAGQARVQVLFRDG